MGFFSDLFGRMFRGKDAKQPEVMDDAAFEASIQQSVTKMKAELNSVVRASADAISHSNRLEADYRHYQRVCEDWQGRAKLALENEDDDLARRALVKKNEAKARLDTLQPGVDEARATSSRLKEQMTVLRRRIDEAQRNARTLVARRNAARAAEKVSRSLAGMSQSNCAFATLEAYEATVVEEELGARAYQRLAEAVADPAERAARELGDVGGAEVDSELAQLRAELGRD
ncbi:MAG: PspA/IM30 family protein [Planctomycetota bacterium]